MSNWKGKYFWGFIERWGAVGFIDYYLLSLRFFSDIWFPPPKISTMKGWLLLIPLAM